MSLDVFQRRFLHFYIFSQEILGKEMPQNKKKNSLLIVVGLIPLQESQ